MRGLIATVYFSKKNYGNNFLYLLYKNLLFYLNNRHYILIYIMRYSEQWMRRLTVWLYYRRNELSYNFLKEKDQNNFICAKIHFYYDFLWKVVLSIPCERGIEMYHLVYCLNIRISTINIFPRKIYFHVSIYSQFELYLFRE